MAAVYDDFIEKYWGDLIRSGQEDKDLQKFKQARAVAKAHGFAYKNMAEVLNSPLDEILSRVEAVGDDPKGKSQSLLGTVKAPSVALEECMDQFWPLCADRFSGKSDNQIRKYKHPRHRAMRNFIAVVGNLDLAKVERSHILQFRSWLMEKIEAGELVGSSANKQMSQVKDVLHTVALAHEIETDFKLLFAQTFMKQDTRSRPPFEASYVQEKLLDAMPFEGLNHEARMLIYMMMETGAREAEIIGLDPQQDFFLQADIPHIWIRKNRLRDLKTKSSDRKVPLSGISLWAAQQVLPQGFARYHHNSDSASATISKYFRENDLKPTPQHTLYSLRHTFKDRLRDAGAPEEVIDELMGHTKTGPQYGRGHTLETKHRWLQQIAFKVPESL